MRKACILSVSGADLLPEEAKMLSEQQPWGMILMGRSCVSRQQVRKLIDDIWEALGRPCLVFIDQEGGRVARLRAPEWPIFPAGRAYAELYASNPDAGIQAAWLGHRLMAEELAALSIHADCAPVLDLPVAGAHDIIGDRALGHDPLTIATLGRAALEGLAAGGVAGVIKHIPGHGRAMSDSHVELPRVTASEEDLRSDFDAFARLADAPMAMTAHIAYDAFDAERPATQSKIMVEDIIRNRIGFDGLLMTDDLGMAALTGSLAERADASIAAGCDVLLHCSGFLNDPREILREMTEVATAAPALEGRALERADRADSFATDQTTFNASEGWTEFREFFPELKGAA